MDTSSEYINMCRKAKELQEMWGPSRGDWFVLYDEIETIGDYSEDLHPIDYREEFPVSKKNCIWLPRIDQLIKISGMGWYNFMVYCTRMADIAGVFRHHMLEHFIMCLMHYKYKKKWNGEDWI